MSTLVTLSEFHQYFDPAQDPSGAEADALLQVILDRAEAEVTRQLIGVELAPPVAEDVKQIVLELAFSIYQTRGGTTLIQEIGVEGQGGYTYTGQLTTTQKAALLQVRISAGGVAV